MTNLKGTRRLLYDFGFRHYFKNYATLTNHFNDVTTIIKKILEKGNQIKNSIQAMKNLLTSKNTMKILQK